MSLCQLYGGSIRAHLPLLCLSACLSLCAPLFSTPASANKCKDLVSKGVDVTKGLQSYIGELLGKRIIGEPQLIRFIEHLEKGELINPISEDEALTSTALLVQRRGLQQYLDEASLDQKELLAWSRATLEKRARVRVNREEVQEETQDIDQKLEFHPVKRPARFEMRDKEGKKLPVKLTHPIEVQSTPVTQNQWVEIMGENPSVFFEGEGSVVLNFHGKGIRLRPDNPVENVTWWSVLEFANRLSEEHGLPPVYDLSDINWKSGTRSENGTLQPVKDEGHDDKIRIYAKGKSRDPYKGDIYYQAEGYRLPTLAEQMYMLQGGGNTKGDSFFKNEADLETHAWYQGNSGRRTHPVGLLQAMVIDGNNFYDLYGSVSEWGWDQNTFNLKEKGYMSMRKKNSVVGRIVEENKVGVGSVIVGGGFDHGSSRFSHFWSRGLHPSHLFPDVGFRLVRTVNQEDGE